MSTLRDLYGPCLWCGRDYAAIGPVCVDHCSEAYEYLRASEWPIALGHSIARFARRCEVDALVMEITGHAVEMSSGLPWYRLNQVGRAHRDKLLRLAQLARDGGRNG